MAQKIERRSPKQERSRDKVSRIKDAFMYLMSTKKSYFTWGTAEVAARAELSIGTLYSYYKDKESIALDIIKDPEFEGRLSAKLISVNILTGATHDTTN